jgi:hypothetical protein
MPAGQLLPPVEYTPGVAASHRACHRPDRRWPTLCRLAREARSNRNRQSARRPLSIPERGLRSITIVHEHAWPTICRKRRYGWPPLVSAGGERVSCDRRMSRRERRKTRRCSIQLWSSCTASSYCCCPASRAHRPTSGKRTCSHETRRLHFEARSSRCTRASWILDAHVDRQPICYDEHPRMHRRRPIGRAPPRQR